MYKYIKGYYIDSYKASFNLFIMETEYLYFDNIHKKGQKKIVNTSIHLIIKKNII